MNFILGVFAFIFSLLAMVFAFLVHPFGWVTMGLIAGVVSVSSGYGLMSIAIALCAVPASLVVGLVGGFLSLGSAATFIKNMK